MAMFGFSPEDYDEIVEVWPDNWLSFLVMDSMGTQWRTGACGVTGLDYGVLPSVMRLVGVSIKDRSRVFQDIRLMELEVLTCNKEVKD
jgi:presenilin-like A22 family membrane protease